VARKAKRVDHPWSTVYIKTRTGAALSDPFATRHNKKSSSEWLLNLANNMIFNN